MSSDKLENIYKLLTEHNFDANKNVPDEFKCGKCRKILIEACQTRCGCRFCRSCVDEMMNNGCQFCPGITSDCKIGLLSTVQLDYRANNQISNLIVKCPEEMCSFECELLEMSEHLRICGKKCPFYKLGCDVRKMTNEKLIEHFQLENYNHNKTLIGMIDNIKNEIGELREKELQNHEEINKLKEKEMKNHEEINKLREKELKNHEEINKLRENLQLKDEKLESINAEMEMMKMEKLEMENRLKSVEEIFNVEIAKLKSEQEKEMQSIKTEKEELDDQMRIALRNIWYKINEIELELKKRCENDKIESIKSDLIEKIDEIESTNKKEIKSINDKIRLEMKEECKQVIDKSIKQIGIVEQKINQLERNAENKSKEIFEMRIDNVDEVRNKYEYTYIWSEYFYARYRPYKLRLSIYSFDDLLRICLCIYDDNVMNRYLSFPFSADVTMRIINKNNREASKSITKYCKLNKPNNNPFNPSDSFDYRYSELIENGILESNCFIIECFVEFK